MSAPEATLDVRDDDRIVERAVEFIRKLERETEHGFAMQVGEHLFRGLLKGDIDYMRATHRWKTDAIRRIARDPRVDLSEDQLRACVKTYVLVTLFQKKDQEPPDLSPWKWARMWDLVDDPETLFELAGWVSRTRASTDLIGSVVQTVHPYTAAGGRLSDLLLDPARISGGDTPYQRIRRLLGVERKWLSSGPVPGATRRELLRLVREIEALLEGP